MLKLCILLVSLLCGRELSTSSAVLFGDDIERCVHHASLGSLEVVSSQVGDCLGPFGHRVLDTHVTSQFSYFFDRVLSIQVVIGNMAYAVIAAFHCPARSSVPVLSLFAIPVIGSVAIPVVPSGVSSIVGSVAIAALALVVEGTRISTSSSAVPAREAGVGFV